MNNFGLVANLIDAFFLILGKTGKLLNARGKRVCFIIDLLCVAYWFYMDIQRELYSQAISAIVSAIIAIYGYRQWGKKPPVN